MEALELLRGVGNLCAGADPRYDARRMVGLLLDGLLQPLANVNGGWVGVGFEPAAHEFCTSSSIPRSRRRNASLSTSFCDRGADRGSRAQKLAVEPASYPASR